MTGGLEELETSRGARVRLEIDAGRTMSVVVDGGGEPRKRVSIPYPSAGYGGHELLLSSNERYLVLWLYSGQSQIGFELFTFAPVLKHVASLPYVLGEGLGPAFSADERYLAVASATNSSLNLEEVCEADVTQEPCVIAWADVHARALPDGVEERCRVDVRIPAGFPCEGDVSYYPTDLSVAADEVAFRTGWGVQVRIPLPLPPVFVIAGPSER
ncbi:MAG: hypothetical protein U0228_13585 [Myxococcaceae bacterium]